MLPKKSEWKCSKVTGECDCIGTSDCAPPEGRKIINAIRNTFDKINGIGNQLIGELKGQGAVKAKGTMKTKTHGSAVGCNVNEVCCGFDMGEAGKTYKCVSEDKCIKSY